MAQISLIPLQEWIECPLLPTTTTLPAPVAFTGGDELILTPDGSAFNGAPSFNGRLPNANELNGAPFYHVYVRAYGAVAGSDNTDRFTVSVDGNPFTERVLVQDTSYDEGVFYTFVPSEAQNVTITAGALTNTDPSNVIVSFLVPVFPQNTSAEDISLDQIRRWQNSPVRPIEAPAVLNLVAAAPPTALVLPTALERDGSPWAYLSMALEAANTANPAGVLLYANGEPVSSTGFDATGVNTSVQPRPPSPEFAKPTDWRLRLPLDGQTYEIQAVTQNVDVQYTWLIPDVPEVA